MNFWTQLENRKITGKEGIESYLVNKLGEPTNQLSSNCLTEITRKINSYYQEDTPKNFTIYTLIGCLTSPEQILERRFREGKNLGQSYYVLKVGSDSLQVNQEELPAGKWEQIKNLTLLNQKLVFKYRKFYTNKQLLDFYPYQENF